MSPDDEIFHPAGDDPHWLESVWTSFHVPERDLNGWIYVWHDVRTGTAGVWALAWGVK